MIKIKKIEINKNELKKLEKLAIDLDLTDQNLIGLLLRYCLIHYHTLDLKRFLNENNN